MSPAKTSISLKIIELSEFETEVLELKKHPVGGIFSIVDA